MVDSSETMRPSFIWMVRDARRAMFMSCVTKNQRHVLFAVQPDNQLKNQLRVFAVEIAGRFVREKNGGTIGKAAGNRDPLPFSAR